MSTASGNVSNGGNKEGSNDLSFFTAADDDDTSSGSENDEETGENHKELPIIREQPHSNSGIGNKLPSPSTLFATVGKPKFLETALKPNKVDWNSISRRYEPLYEYSSVSYPAERVDLESEERNEASISGAPIKYKTEISETKKHLFLHGKRSSDIASALASNIEDKDGETCEKKKKLSS